MTATVASDDIPSAAADAQRGDPSRLAVVRSLGLLDTQPEAAFDDLTRLAAVLLRVPASFVAVVDGDRDFYKSQFGFDEPLATTRELRGRSFCHYTLDSQQPLVINDTHADPVWKAVPTVQSLGVRAYLGVPLWVAGQPVGSLCAIDNQPHAWTSEEIETLRQLAHSAVREIDLRVALRAAVADAERLQSLTRHNEELLAVIAHDLRTPLQVVGISAAQLQRLPDAEGQAHGKRIAAAVDAIARMVDDLLATSAMEGVAAHRRGPVAARKLLLDTEDTMGPVAARAGITLAVDATADSELIADYAQLLRALCNLVGNCIKYCPTGSTVTLRAGVAHDVVCLTVADNGPGMSVADQLRAFERGWQGADGIARRDGAGLGLAIVHAIVEQHGGRVSLTSDAGAGLVVSLYLPSTSAQARQHSLA